MASFRLQHISLVFFSFIFFLSHEVFMICLFSHVCWEYILINRAGYRLSLQRLHSYIGFLEAEYRFLVLDGFFFGQALEQGPLQAGSRHFWSISLHYSLQFIIDLSDLQRAHVCERETCCGQAGQFSSTSPLVSATTDACTILLLVMYMLKYMTLYQRVRVGRYQVSSHCICSMAHGRD